LASYETSAKDFLYPYSSDRIQYTGLRRYILLSRTIDFPGISPSFEFSVSPSIDDVTGIKRAMKTRKSTKPIDSYGKSVRYSFLFLNEELFILFSSLNDQNHQHGNHHLHIRIGNFYFILFHRMMKNMIK